MTEIRKTVRVVAAIIQKENLFFATRRGYGPWRGGWEFPGGKIEPGETPENALKREILEELDTEICVDGAGPHVEYDYPDFHLSMDCFFCGVKNGKLLLKEHEDARWLQKEKLDNVDWLPADRIVVTELKKTLK